MIEVWTKKYRLVNLFIIESYILNIKLAKFKIKEE